MQRDIRHLFFFPHPPEVVWNFLTDSDLLAEWLMPNDFKAEVGHQFQFKTRPKRKFSFDGTVYCEVLEVVPPKKLVYSWKGGLSKEKPMLDSVVVWTLTPKDEGTELLLEHKGFKGIKNYLPFLIMSKGWLKIGKRFLDHLNSSSR